jgi:undecaprenyl diphosphate synthase
MGLFVQYLEKEVAALAAAGVRLRVIGDVAVFAPELQTRIYAAEKATQHNQDITLVIAANYGGRWDVLQAVKEWGQSHPGKSLIELTEQSLLPHLSTADMPDVDLLIRTGGERRISNFFLWQAAYAELYFSDVLWPDFSDLDMTSAIEWFASRSRRFGKTLEQVER